MWDLHTGEIEFNLQRRKDIGRIRDIQLLPNDTFISNSDTELQIWDLSGKCLHWWTVSMNYINKIYVMPLQSSIKIIANYNGDLIELE